MLSPQVQPIVIPTKSSLKSYNFYLVRSEEKVFLVDAGVDSDTCWNKFNERLTEMNLELTDIDAIILTHHHADHIGLVNRIREIHDVPVFAHPKAFPRLRRDETFLQKRIRFFERLYKNMGCGEESEVQVNRLREAVIQNKSRAIKGNLYPIEEGANFYGFSIIEMPGHADDHIVLLDEEYGILFSGDNVIDHITTNALIDLGDDGERTQSLLQYEQSLIKLRELPVNTIYSGHGKTIDDAQAVIDEKLNKINKKADRILSHLTTQHTAAEIAKEMYKTRYKSLFPLVMSEVIGHLDRLVNLGNVSVEVRKGIIYYEKIINPNSKIMKERLLNSNERRI